MSLDIIEAQASEHLAQENELRASLEGQFRQSAQGRAWFDGIFPHQWQASCFGAVAERFVLGDEPGAGKTRASVGWTDLVGAKKIFVMCEANLASQFSGEVMELAEHRTIVNLTKKDLVTRKEMVSKILRMDEAIVFLNYEMFRKDQESLGRLMLWQADTMIVDEAHNLKNVKTSNFKHVEKLVMADNTCPSCGGLIFGVARQCGVCGWKKENPKALPESLAEILETKSVKRLLLMTGTPLLNTPMDLFALLHLVDPKTFSSEGRFKKLFLQMNYHAKKWEFKHNGVEALRPYIEDRYLARTLSEVGIELPKQRVHVERVELDPERYPLQARTVKQVTEHFQIMLSTGESMTLMHLITVILRKRQAMVWPGGIEMKDEDGNVIFSVGKEVQESCIMDAAMERILEIHKEGRRQVVFSQFSTALVEFEDRLRKKGLRVVRMDGSTPDAMRNQIKTNFYAAKKEVPKWDIVLVNYKTGGSGLNLTSTTATHILDEEWNSGKRNQAYARNHRIGQEHETDVYVYRVPNSVCTWMANLIERKERMVNQLGRAMSRPELTSRIKDAIQTGEM